MKLLFTIVLLMNSAAYAESDRGYISDRPGATDNPKTLENGKYRMEIETYYFSREIIDEKAKRIKDFGGITLVRGLGQNGELQIGGWKDLQLRFKQNVFGNDEGKLALAILPNISVGSEEDGRHVSGGIGLPVSYELTPKLSLSIMPQADWIHDAEGKHIEVYIGSVMGYSFTEKLNTFIEYFGTYSEQHYSPMYGLGLTYMLTDKMQLDVSGDFETLTNTGNQLFSCGVVYAF